MATGDKVLATRVRADSNERLDLVDFDAMAITAQLHLEAAFRALLSSPKATAGSPTGERWTGSITANPTSGSDNLVRLDTPVFIGFDANGGLVLKPNGITLSVAIPADGTDQQVYVYMKDVAENTQVRRKLPATAPFNEFSAAINVALRQTADLYVRAGSIGSVVAQDAIASVTRPLLFLGIANNTGGNVTFVPAANMLETVTAPGAVPATSAGTTTGETTVTGAAATLRELLNVALHQIGQIAWKGSAFLTPSAANNFGAYQTPAGGIDAAYRGQLGYVTIGNGTTVLGDFNTTDYPNAKLLLDAAIASLPAQGGTIILKRGVALSGFASAAVALPAGKTVEIIGDHKDKPATVPQLTFAASEKLTCSATGALVLRNLHVRWVDGAVSLTTAPCTVINCFFEKLSGTDAGAALQGSNVNDLRVDDTSFSTDLSAASLNAMAVRITGVGRRIFLTRLTAANKTTESGMISIADTREDIVMDGIEITTDAPGSFGVLSPVIKLATTDNTTDVRNRRLKNVVVATGMTISYVGIDFSNVGHLYIENLQHLTAKYGLRSTVGVAAPVFVTNMYAKYAANTLVAAVAINGQITEPIEFNQCYFGLSVGVGDMTDTVKRATFSDCTFRQTFNGVAGTVVFSAQVKGCTFEGIQNTSSNDICAFFVKGSTSIDQVEFCDNTILDFQNVAFSGSTVPPRFLEIDCDTVNSVIVHDNIAKRIMNNSSGNTRRGAYLVDISSTDRTADSLGSTGSVSIKGNILGDSNEAVGLLKLSKRFFYQIDIQGNTVRTVWNSNASQASFEYLVNINCPNVGGASADMFTFDNNKVFIVNASITDLSRDLIFISAVGGQSCYSMSFTNNQIEHQGSLNKFDFATAWGIQTVGVIPVNLTVKGNTAARQTTSATAWFETKINVAPTRTLPTGGVPAAGVAWGENNLVHGG